MQTIRRELLLHMLWCVCVFVCLLDTSVSCATAAEPVEMRFGTWTSGGPRNHVLDRGPHPHENWHFWASYLGMSRLARGDSSDAASGYQHYGSLLLSSSFGAKCAVAG